MADDPLARRDAARWFCLAVSALAIAGLSSIVLVISRVPGMGGDAAFARRSLVVHVNLALGVWFLACIGGLFCLLPGRPRFATAPVALAISTLGVLCFAIPMFFVAATPILSDYVPALDDHLFLTGLTLLAAGVALNFLDPRIIPSRGGGGAASGIPVAAQNAVRAAAASFVIAMLTIAGAWVNRDLEPDRAAYFQHLFWGGGHVLQVSHSLGMVAAWLILLQRLTGRPVLHGFLPTLLFAVLLAPTLLGPWLTLRNHPAHWFTVMMEWGIFPAVSIFIIYVSHSLWRSRALLRGRGMRTPGFIGLLSSMVLTVVGFILGAMITFSTTVVPAHYHANIGAVTVAYMAMLLTFLHADRRDLPWPRLTPWQPLMFAAGQLTFAVGLGLAGLLGDAQRKSYGAEQHVRSSVERLGLTMAGAGGLVAFLAGGLFILLCARAALSRTGTAPPAGAGGGDSTSPAIS